MKDDLTHRAQDVIFNREKNMYQMIYFKFNPETRSAIVDKVVDISKHKYKAAIELNKYVSNKIVKGEGL